MDEQNEAFQLDIAKYKDTGNAEEFLSSGFEERFKYPFRAFEFLPKEMVLVIRTFNYPLFFELLLFQMKRATLATNPKEVDEFFNGPRMTCTSAVLN